LGGLYSDLKKNGYEVSVVQIPTTSLEDDLAVTYRAIAQAKGPVVLVGHSYGGVVITEAGNDPKVSGLVYIAALREMSKRAGSSTVEVKGSHAIFVSQPRAVAALIEKAVKDASAKLPAN
jgi:pimeloyl-ACP methyl ester carboxylesterase